MSSFFANASKADAGHGPANYLSTGDFYAVIQNAKQKQTRTGRPCTLFEMMIVGVNTAESTHQVGEDVTHMIMLDRDGGMSEQIRLIDKVILPYTYLDSDEDYEGSSEMSKKEKEEILDGAYVSEDDKEVSPLSGAVVHVTAMSVPLKEGNGTFTRVNYKSVLEPASVKQLVESGEINEKAFNKATAA